jgi:uncharacterized protein YodC (DUF2158 family)
MENVNFQAGNVVRLKSGSSEMTITHLSEKSARCVIHNKTTNKIEPVKIGESEEISLELLKKANGFTSTNVTI